MLTKWRAKRNYRASPKEVVNETKGSPMSAISDAVAAFEDRELFDANALEYVEAVEAILALDAEADDWRLIALIGSMALEDGSPALCHKALDKLIMTPRPGGLGRPSGARGRPALVWSR